MKIRVPTSIELLNQNKECSNFPEHLKRDLQSAGPGWYPLKVFENDIFIGNRLGYVRQTFSGDGHVEIVYTTRKNWGQVFDL